MSSRGTFIRGAVILAVAGIASRFLGFPLRILLARVIGAEGMGLYGVAYPVYSVLLVISTAGIPVAISKLVSEKITLKDYREATRIFRIALPMLGFTGLTLTLLLLGSANFIAVNVVLDARAVYSMLAIAPAIFFVTIMSAFRGFFQGQQQMFPTAMSQVVEQAARFVVALYLAMVLLPAGLEFAAAGAAAGALAGGIFGLAVLVVLYWRHRPYYRRTLMRQHAHNPAPAGEIIKRIFRLAIPVTLGGLVMLVNDLINMAIVPRQLQETFGLSVEASMALYGHLTGYAGSIVNFPNAVALAMSMSLVPAIAEGFALRNRPMIAGRSAVSIKLITLFALPAAVGLFQLADPIMVMLFKDVETGYPLNILAWSVIPLCIYVATTGILQGLGRTIAPVKSMVYGGLFKAILTWYLTTIPSLHVGGAALASVIGFGVAAALNLVYVARYTGWRFRFRELLLLPGLSVAVMYLAVRLTYQVVSHAGAALMSPGQLNALSTLAAILCGICIYGVSLLLSGSISREELLMIPRIGERLVALAVRLRLLR